MNHSSDLSRDTLSANSIRSSGPTVINASTGIPPSPRTRRRSTSFSSSSSSSIRYPSICRIALRLCRRPVGLGALVTMFKSAAENVKAFVATRPPLVLFLIFLTSCAATLLFMTVYLRNNQIRDPTEENDWNLFLENFAKIDFCVESRRYGCHRSESSCCMASACYFHSFRTTSRSFFNSVVDLFIGLGNYLQECWGYYEHHFRQCD